MRIIKGDPRTAKEKFYAKPTRAQIELYNHQIKNFPACKHLKDDDSVSFMIRMHILAELMSPENQLSNQIWFWRAESFNHINN